LILGIVALIWTLDTLYSVYLTFPISTRRFFSRWKKSWQIKIRASTYRINFDLHRACGLWTLLFLLMFAWSSVMFCLPDTYDATMNAVFGVRPLASDMPPVDPSYIATEPKLNWSEALNRSEVLMNQLSAQNGFKVIRPFGFSYIEEYGVYSYSVRSDIDFSVNSWDGTGLWMDGDSGALRHVFLPYGHDAAGTISKWIRTLHFANLYDWMWYRILTCLLGLVVTMLSVTGIYIWWKKRAAKEAAERNAGILQS